MRLVFLGSPQEVIAPLQDLIATKNHEVVAVVSQPAKPVGRKGVLTDPPVAAFAKEAQIACFQPEKASQPEFLAELRRLDVDVMVTAAYGQILTEEFLAIPKRATINVHPSKLPQYRGAIPVPAALLDGLDQTAVSILFTVKKLDAGALILQKEFAIASDETQDKLTARLFAASGPMLLEALDLLAASEFSGQPQDESRVTHCRKISKSDGKVDWQMSATNIYNRFRAFFPWPGSYTSIGDKRVVLTGMRPVAGPNLSPGTLQFSKQDKAVLVGTGDGCLALTQLKPEGKKAMDAAGFWNGIKDKENAHFDS